MNDQNGPGNDQEPKPEETKAPEQVKKKQNIFIRFISTFLIPLRMVQGFLNLKTWVKFTIISAVLILGADFFVWYLFNDKDYTFKALLISTVVLAFLATVVFLHRLYYEWMIGKYGITIVPRGKAQFLWPWIASCFIWFFFHGYMAPERVWFIHHAIVLFVVLTLIFDLDLIEGIVLGLVIGILSLGIVVANLKGWPWFSDIANWIMNIKLQSFCASGQLRIGIFLLGCFLFDWAHSHVKERWYFTRNAIERRRFGRTTEPILQEDLRYSREYPDGMEVLLGGSGTIFLKDTNGNVKFRLENIPMLTVKGRVLDRFIRDIGITSEGNKLTMEPKKKKVA